MSDTPTTPPPLPSTFNIPQATVARWMALDEDAPLTAPITRREVDYLFHAIDSALKANVHLSNCLTHYSNGRNDDANLSLFESNRHAVEGANMLRQFMNGLMASNVP